MELFDKTSSVVLVLVTKLDPEDFAVLLYNASLFF